MPMIVRSPLTAVLIAACLAALIPPSTTMAKPIGGMGAMHPGDRYLLDHLTNKRAQSIEKPRPVADRPIFDERSRASTDLRRQRQRRVTIGVGPGDLMFEGFRVRNETSAMAAATGRPDRKVLWGVRAALVEPLGSNDSLSLGLSGEFDKRRSAFTPYQARTFRSGTASADFAWQHGDRLCLRASYRVVRSRGIDSPFAAIAFRTTDAEPAGRTIQLTLGYQLAAQAPAGDRPDVSLGLLARQRTGDAWASPTSETGVKATLRVPF